MAETISTIGNKPLAIMAVEVKTQAFVLWINIGDNPQYSELETATIAIAKTLRCHRFAMASQRARGCAALSGTAAYATAPNSAIGVIPPICTSALGKRHQPRARYLQGKQQTSQKSVINLIVYKVIKKYVYNATIKSRF